MHGKCSKYTHAGWVIFNTEFRRFYYPTLPIYSHMIYANFITHTAAKMDDCLRNEKPRNAMRSGVLLLS